MSSEGIEKYGRFLLAFSVKTTLVEILSHPLERALVLKQIHGKKGGELFEKGMVSVAEHMMLTQSAGGEKENVIDEYEYSYRGIHPISFLLKPFVGKFFHSLLASKIKNFFTKGGGYSNIESILSIAPFVVSGFLVNAASFTVLYPILRPVEKMKADITEEGIFGGYIDAFRKIFQKEGFLGLYKGYFTTLFCVFLDRLLVFSSMHCLQMLVMKKKIGVESATIFVKYLNPYIITLALYPFSLYQKRVCAGDEERYPIRYMCDTVQDESVGGLCTGWKLKLVHQVVRSLCKVVVEAGFSQLSWEDVLSILL